MQDLQTERETKVRLVIMSSVNALIKFEWKTVRGLRTAAKGAAGRETGQNRDPERERGMKCLEFEWRERDWEGICITKAVKINHCNQTRALNTAV